MRVRDEDVPSSSEAIRSVKVPPTSDLGSSSGSAAFPASAVIARTVDSSRRREGASDELGGWVSVAVVTYFPWQPQMGMMFL